MAKFNINKTKLPVVCDNKGDCGYVIKLNQCNIGEFVRLVSKNGNIQKRVYIVEEYDKRERKYLLTAFNDINSYLFAKGDLLVFVGFEF